MDRLTERTCNLSGDTELAKLEQAELERYRHRIVADVKKMVEHYRAIFDWDVPDIDQRLADRLILSEIRKGLDDVEKELDGATKPKSG